MKEIFTFITSGWYVFFLADFFLLKTTNKNKNVSKLTPPPLPGNCYDAHQYGSYSLYCPYAYRLPNGTLLAKDLAAEYNYLGNSSIWFYNARTKAQEIIDKNAPIYRGQSSKNRKRK